MALSAKFGRSTVLILFLAFASFTGTATAAPTVSPSDIDAAVRTLSFVDSLPQQGTLAIGVVYAGDDKAEAVETATRLASLAGPHGSQLKANPIAVEALAATGHLDVLYILPGVAESHSAAVAQFVRRYRAISISNDPACIDSQCCVLFVRSGTPVNIVLNVSLSEATGTTFGPVFEMMVKRK